MIKARYTEQELDDTLQKYFKGNKNLLTEKAEAIGKAYGIDHNDSMALLINSLLIYEFYANADEKEMLERLMYNVHGKVTNETAVKFFHDAIAMEIQGIMPKEPTAQLSITGIKNTEKEYTEKNKTYKPLEEIRYNRRNVWLKRAFVFFVVAILIFQQVQIIQLKKETEEARQEAAVAHRAATSAQNAADDAQYSADEAQSAADDAQSTADDAQDAVDNAQW